MKTIKLRALNRGSVPPRMMYWGEDFYVVSLKHGSMRIKESPGNEYFELHVLTNKSFKKSMPSCQGDVILMRYTWFTLFIEKLVSKIRGSK